MHTMYVAEHTHVRCMLLLQVLDKDFLLPIGKAKIQRPGKDVTLVSFSKMVGYCLKAADELAQQGIDCEVRVLRALHTLSCLGLKTCMPITEVEVYMDCV
jgi:pyruvate/2-oxoglutarate/acetoin dehydrogenase E1 component